MRKEMAVYLEQSNNGRYNFSRPTTGIFFMSQHEAMVMMKKEISCERYGSKNWWTQAYGTFLIVLACPGQSHNCREGE
jgi:hypothetical protein